MERLLVNVFGFYSLLYHQIITYFTSELFVQFIIKLNEFKSNENIIVWFSFVQFCSVQTNLFLPNVYSIDIIMSLNLIKF